MRGHAMSGALRARLAVAICLLLCAVSGLAACGDSSSGGSSSGSSGGEQAVTADKLKLAQERTAKESQRPMTIRIKTPLKKLPPRGLQVAMPSATSATWLTYIKRIKEAFGLLGFKINVFSFQQNQDSIRQALSSATSSSPKGIVLNNLPVEFRTKETQQWVDEGLPILANGSTDKNQKNLVNYIDGDIVGVNTQEAVDWIVADAKGKPANIVYFTDDTLPCCKDQAPYVEKRLKEYCPSCQFHKFSIQLGDVGTKLPGQIVSYLQANPQYNYGVFILGDFAVGLPAALKASGLADKFKFCTTSGTEANYQYIKDGTQACDVSYDDAGAAYMGADLFARALTGQPIDEDQKWRQDVQIITKSNLFWPINQPYPGAPNQEQQWKKLWGIG
jgi:ribose transport system substrate-binding protein